MEQQRAKLVLLGDAAVGKTSIVHWMMGHSFLEAHSPTVGMNFREVPVTSASGSVIFHVFDTAGEERFRSLAPMFCQNANVVLIVFDLSVRSSFQDDLIDYFVDCAERASEDALFFLVGNKTDLETDRSVTIKAATEMAERINARYFETSALTGQGIQDLFCAIVDDPGLRFSGDAPAAEKEDKRVNVEGADPRHRKKGCDC
jgi:small GTP-binding protein